ncbi:MAG: universal stress protein [Actinomycetota bacterium]|nr:universal stress protein [Actinomycetota bacterium]
MTGQIVVGIDGSKGSRRALEWALEEGRIRGLRVEAVIVWQSPYDFPGDYDFFSPQDDAAMAEAARARLMAAIGETAGAGTDEIEPVVVEGDPAEALCERAEQAGLLVVGSRGRGIFARLALGSVSSKCAHHSPCPVAIVPAPDRGGEVRNRPAGRVVVGVDGSPGSLRALRWALDEGGARRATVQVVTVWRGVHVDEDMAMELLNFSTLAEYEKASAETARKRLERSIDEAIAESPLVAEPAAVEPAAVEGDAAETLCRFAAEADLLVVGSRGRGSFAELSLGSVSSKCAHHCPRPVVIVPTERDRHDGA